MQIDLTTGALIAVLTGMLLFPPTRKILGLLVLAAVFVWWLLEQANPLRD